MEQEAKKQRVRQFVRDEQTFQAVFDFVRDYILSKRGQMDVNILAAERLALDFQRDAFSAMSSEVVSDQKEEKPTQNIGL